MARPLSKQTLAAIEAAVVAASKPRDLVIADLSKRLRVLEGGPTDPPAPEPDPPSAPPPPVGTLWRGATWAIVDGKIVRDGRPATDPDRTKDVAEIRVHGDQLYQRNAAGQWYAWSGKPDWTHVPSPPWERPPARMTGDAAIAFDRRKAPT